MATRTRPSLRWRPLRGLSIRWRLTLWYTAVLTVTLMIFSLVVYWFAGTGMIQEVHRNSIDRADQVQDSLVRQLRAEQVFSDAAREELQNTGVIESSVDPFRDPGVGVRLRIYHLGSIAKLASPELLDLSRIPDDRRFIMDAEKGRERHDVLPTAEGPFWVYTRPVHVGSDRAHLRAVVQIFTSLQPHYDRMATLARILLVGTMLGAALAMVVGAAIAQVALAPMTTITRTAGQINRAQDLGRRIPDTGSDDELGRLTVTINEMLDRIQAMFERQRQLVADVSHELRTPLTTIRGEMDLMSRAGVLDREGLEAVRGEAARMSRMVADLLLLAQADSGLVIEHFPVNLGPLVRDVCRQSAALAQEPGTVTSGTVADVTVMGDADRLRQLLLNLVTNALQHNPVGAHVTVSLEHDTLEAQLTVADDGGGIPAADLPHIFERFYRVDKARARRSGGTGLGLSIVKWIAAAHGGSVTVASTLGAGTCFTVHLPLAEGPASAATGRSGVVAS